MEFESLFITQEKKLEEKVEVIPTQEISKKKDLFFLRKLAHTVLDIWENQPGGVNKPFLIPKDLQDQALCQDTSVMKLLDYDREPTAKEFSSKIEYYQAINDHRSHVNKMKTICNTCPLKDMCVTTSVASLKNKKRQDFGVHNISPENHLIWGGFTPAERRDFFVVFKELIHNKYGSEVSV